MYAAEGCLDSDGYTDDPVTLAASVTIDDDGVLFDFSGSDPQRPAPVNSTYAQTHSGAAFVLKCLIDPDVPVNAGFYRNVRMVAPEGTVVNCTEPYPVVGGWETQLRLVDVIFKALAQAIPDRVPAGTEAMICHSGFGGTDPYRDETYCFLETIAGGYGGRASRDGPDAVQPHGKNTANAPVEETELNYPVRITRYELVEDSEGPWQAPGRPGAAAGLLVPRPRGVLHHSRRPRALGPPRPVRRALQARGRTTCSTPAPMRRSLARRSRCSSRRATWSAIAPAGAAGTALLRSATRMPSCPMSATAR